MNRELGVVVGALTCALCACGGPGAQQVSSYPPAKIQTAEDAKKWASMSAPNMYFVGSSPFLLAAFSASSSDGGCPVKTDDGTTVRYTGGCTAPGGSSWSGSASFARATGPDGKPSDAGFGAYRYDGLTVQSSVTCDGGTATAKGTYDGTSTVSGTPEDVTFQVDLRGVGSGVASGACATPATSVAYSYSGSFKGADTSRTWNGSGKAGSSTLGGASVSTKDEVISPSVCGHEAASGTTTVTAGSTTLLITYDGATKCDSDSRVKWSLDGADQGELVGVQCGVAPGGELGALALAVGSAFVWRRRRRHA